MSVHDDRDPREIMEFLLKPIPWCQHCNFDSFAMYPWGRSRREIDEWIDLPASNPVPEEDLECDGAVASGLH